MYTYSRGKFCYYPSNPPIPDHALVCTAYTEITLQVWYIAKILIIQMHICVMSVHTVITIVEWGYIIIQVFKYLKPSHERKEGENLSSTYAQNNQHIQIHLITYTNRMTQASHLHNKGLVYPTYTSFIISHTRNTYPTPCVSKFYPFLIPPLNCNQWITDSNTIPSSLCMEMLPGNEKLNFIQQYVTCATQSIFPLYMDAVDVYYIKLI